MPHSPNKLAALFIVTLLFILLHAGANAAQAQQVQVTAADPPSAEQGTSNLNVKITGKGFKPGASSKFFVTGTADTGGVRVNSTTYISSTTLTANIDVSDTAVIANFDIEVRNADGRTGKGTERFAVTAKGSVKLGCNTTLGTPAGYELVSMLNDGTSAGYLGTAVAAAPVGASRVVVAAGTGSSGYVEIFNLDAMTGTPITSQRLFVNKPIRWLVTGDVDGDGVPDFAGSSGDGPGPILLRGSFDGDNVAYAAFTFPNPPSFSGRRFRKTVALGDLDGAAGDEIALASVTSTGKPAPGQVHLYRFTGGGVEWLRTIDDTAKSGDFGYSVGIGNVTGSAGNQLLVGSSGRVVVVSAPLGTASTLTLTASGSTDLGRQVTGADVNGDGVNDLIAATSNNVLIFPGPVNTSSAPAYQLNPTPDNIGGIWAVWGFHALTDVTGDNKADVLVGAPAVQGSPCQIGVVHVFSSETISQQTPTTSIFQPPAINGDGNNYGAALAAVAADPSHARPAYVLVGDSSRRSGAGEVYVYRRN